MFFAFFSSAALPSGTASFFSALPPSPSVKLEMIVPNCSISLFITSSNLEISNLPSLMTSWTASSSAPSVVCPSSLTSFPLFAAAALAALPIVFL